MASTTLPPTQAPASQEYAGDEINALVLDSGTHTTRAGFAGEDIPKSVIPSSYGVLHSSEKIFGENALHIPRPNMEIRTPFGTDGVVEDWETASRLWEFSITSRLTGAQHITRINGNAPAQEGQRDDDGDVTMDGLEQVVEQERILGEFPLMMSEPSWNPLKAREKTIEIAMEDWGVPAFFLAKNGQLAAYSQGKATALVVDIGHRHTSVTALWEGMVLRKSLLHTPLAGHWMNEQVRVMLAGLQPSAPLIPHYMIKSKSPVDAGAPSNATYASFSSPPTQSFRQQEEERVLLEFKESVVQLWPGPGKLDVPPSTGGVSNVDQVKQLPPKPFEMPDGWNRVFGIERFRVAEGLFDHTASYVDTEHPMPAADQTIISVADRALQACDVDTRPHLMNNIVLTGAGSLIDKLPERLQSDLQTIYPNPKVRVIANSNSAERKFGSWIGGSVLSSLGTFHQMWISKQEYEEFGAKIVEKRCK